MSRSAAPGSFPGFTEQLEGLSPGESRTFDATFPEGYGVADLAGKQASFEITAKTLKRPEVPGADDGLARSSASRGWRTWGGAQEAVPAGI